MMFVKVLLYFYFLYIKPSVNPYAHLCTIIALAKPKTPIVVDWIPTARHSKKEWIDIPACKMNGLKLAYPC